MNQTTSIKFKGMDFNIGFPNVGELLQIESNKMILSNGKYGEMVNSGTKSSIFALDLIDAISTFTELNKELKDVLPKKSYTEMSINDANELVKVYKDQYYPWFSGLMKEVENAIN